MPGPNDYHVIMDGETPNLHPGLGKDEPSEQQRTKMRDAGAAKIQRMKEELAAAGAELTEREKTLIAKEQALEKRERELAAAERAAAVPAGKK